MKPAPFAYHRPESKAEALSMLADLDTATEQVEIEFDRVGHRQRGADLGCVVAGPVRDQFHEPTVSHAGVGGHTRGIRATESSDAQGWTARCPEGLACNR